MTRRIAMARGTLAATVLCLFVLTSCSEETRDAIRSRASDAIGSASLSPSLPSLPSRTDEPTESEEPSPSRQPTPTEEPTPEEPSPTEEPTPEEPSPTEEPTPEEPTATEEPPPTEEPSEVTQTSLPSGSAQADTGFPWPWLVVGLAVAGGAGALVMRRSSTRKAQEDWRSRARGVHAMALELHDLIATELVAARSGAQLSPVLWTEASSTFDQIDDELRQLQADPPDQTSGVAAQDLALSTSAVRSALLVLTSATGDDDVRRGLAQTLSERLETMAASIGRFGSSLGPGPVTR